MRRLGISLILFLYLLTLGWTGEPGPDVRKSGKRKMGLSPSFLMREEKLLVKNIQPVYKKAFFNPRATFRKKHLAIIFSRLIESNLSQTLGYSEEYNGYRYYKKVLPSRFLDERPRNQELFGIVERLIERKILKYEKDGKFHPEKPLSRGEVFFNFIKLLELTNLEDINIPSIYKASLQLNQHLSRVSDISGKKDNIPGFIRMAEYYNLLPPLDDKVYLPKDFFLSFRKGKSFYLSGKNGPYFGVPYKANLAFITYLLADNFVKWDLSAYLPQKGKGIGNRSKDYINKTLSKSSLVDAYVTGFDPETGIVFVKAKRLGDERENEYTFYLPSDAYLWIVDKGIGYQLKNPRTKLQKLGEILKKFNTARLYRFSVNGLFKVIPMKLKNNIKKKRVVLKNGKSVLVPEIGYLEIILNRFDYNGSIIGKNGDLLRVKLEDGQEMNFVVDSHTKVKTRIYSDNQKFLKTIYDELLKPENFNYFRPGIRVSFKTDSSSEKIKYLLIPLFKIGAVKGVDLEKRALQTTFSLNKVYFLKNNFSATPLYLVSKRESGYIRETSFSSLMGIDGSLLPLQLYVQPVSVKAYPLSKNGKKIPQLQKITLGIGIE